MSAKDFVACARAQLGKQYRWGTAGPDTFDCSGLTSYCWEQVMHEPMTRSSHQQFLLGDPVADNESVQPGDLVFWGTDGTQAGHVAVAVGEGRVVHAMNEQRDVIESSIHAPMGGPLTGIRRLDFGAETLDPPKVRRRRKRRKEKRR